jgi:hypothetical protein
MRDREHCAERMAESRVCLQAAATALELPSTRSSRTPTSCLGNGCKDLAECRFCWSSKVSIWSDSPTPS